MSSVAQRATTASEVIPAAISTGSQGRCGAKLTAGALLGSVSTTIKELIGLGFQTPAQLRSRYPILT
jgi:hypothetical protein